LDFLEPFADCFGKLGIQALSVLSSSCAGSGSLVAISVVYQRTRIKKITVIRTLTLARVFKQV